MRRILTVLLVAVLTLTGCGFHGLYGADLPGGANLGSHPFGVTIYFDDVLDLVPQSAVKVNDVPVGRVEQIALSNAADNSGDKATNGWTARVTIKVNGDVDLPKNARAVVKQTSLLGEKYVDLEQPIAPAARARLGNGDTIPITSTGSAPETEEVLGALSLLLNGGGLPEIKVITTELNNALDGNEAAVRDLLGRLNSFVGTLDAQKTQIITALGGVDRLARTLNDNRAKIVAALNTFPKALEILKNNRSRLTTLLTSLSGLGTVATRVITATQTNLVSALKSLGPAVQQLAASGSNLVNSLKIAGTFPFPLKTSLTAVRGDYANLNLFVDLNLSNELCGLSKQLCSVVKGNNGGLLPQSTSSTPLAGTNPIAGPTLVGVQR